MGRFFPGKETQLDIQKPIIRLWQVNGIGLIIAHPSGVIYSNQTGGFACNHRKMEGVFVPLANSDVDQQAELEAYFTGPKWRGHCYNGIDEETAGVIERILKSSFLTSTLKVDRERLLESEEAWIHVNISTETGEGESYAIDDFPGGTGVITWDNSD
jgi:hypothetical protein